jgi:pSer/pThr/pTyr-binding forkhead associated (FHA) protein
LVRIIRYLAIAALGGLIGWLIVEPIDYLTPPGNPSVTYLQQILLGAIIGLFIGTALGLAEAISGLSPRDAVKSIVLGAAIGAAGGAMGLIFGNAFYGPLHQASVNMDAPSMASDGTIVSGGTSVLGFITEMIGRTIGWAFFGTFLGVTQGLSVQSNKKMVNGAIGGFIGGFVGGFIFAILNSMNDGHVMSIPVAFMRMIGFTVVGAAIGLFIGLIEELTKQAWLIKLVGKNEGKEIMIFKPQTIGGRDELIDIPIFGDPDVEPRHFVIKADQRRHLIQDLNTSSGTFVNGQKIQQPQLLKDGDVIQVGMTKLKFRDKATRSLISSGSGGGYSAGPRIPTSGMVCPYCGDIKDANGNCSCTLGAGQAPPTPPGAPVSQTQSATVIQPAQPQPLIPMGQTIPMGTPTAGKPSLIGISGPYQGQTYELIANGETTIGRQSDRNIALSTDNTVSRQHARIADEGGQFVIYDLGSANGTHVNNSPITRQVLANGDMVQVGSTKFRFDA